MAKKTALAGEPTPTFEEALARLETIVRELEEAELPLERSLVVFEEGVRLSRLLHERLNEAERKVEILMRNEDGEKVPMPFAAAAEAPAAGSPGAAGSAAGDAEDDDDEDDTTGGTPSGQRALPF